MNILIITSKNHWNLGWFELPENLEFMIDAVMKEKNFDIQVTEVANTVELDKVLDILSKDTLIWTNAYYVKHKNGQIWLNEHIEKRGFSILGSGSEALKNVLQKNICQSILEKANIPIPANAILLAKDIRLIKEFFLQCTIDFPLVLKPTGESASAGVYLVHNEEEAIEKGQKF